MKDSLLNQWTCCYSDGNDQPYYVNEYTRKLSWEKPVGYIEPVSTEPKMNATAKVVATDKQSSKKPKPNQSQNGKSKKTQQTQKKKYPFEDEPLDE